MKKLFILSLAGALAFASCKTEDKTVGKDVAKTTKTETKKVANELDMKSTKVQPALDPTTIKIDRTMHDFGKINEGDIVKTTFKITNTGDQPLVLNKPKVSCGCTTPSYPNKPLAPGESADLEVQFNSSNKPNLQKKDVTLTGNFKTSPAKVSFKALVNPKAKPAKTEAKTDSHAGHNH